MSKPYMSQDDQAFWIGTSCFLSMFTICPLIGIIVMIYKGFLIGMGIAVLSFPLVLVLSLIFAGWYFQTFYHN